MERDRYLLLSLLMILIMIFTSGCVDVGIDEDDVIFYDVPWEDVPGKTVTEDGMVFELRVGNVSWIDDPRFPIEKRMGVNLSLKVSWEGPGNWSGIFPSSQRYNFTATKDGVIIWDWAQGFGFLAVIITFTLIPGTVMYFNDTWFFENNSIEAGTYIVEGFFIPVEDTVEKEMWLAPIE